jgi:hypothetical protein
MFCDRCGAPLQPNQRFCGQCGRDFAGTLAQAQFGPNRVQEHLRFIAILWLALSVINAIAGAVLLILGNTLFPHLRELSPTTPPDVPVGFLSSLFCFLGGLVLIKAALGFLAGWGLLQRERWARTLTLVLSFLALLNIPLGTALGVYSLWVLLPEKSEREYQQEVARAVTA